MKIHEYQAKKVLRDHGIPVPGGGVAASPEEAVSIASVPGGTGWVVKAQIHAGGRGKGGGIRLASTVDDVAAHAKALLSSRLVTPQTGPEGQRVKLVLVEEQIPLQTELYAGVVVDRGLGRAVLLTSAAGGMDIEEVAQARPESIHREILGPWGTLRGFQARRATFAMGLPAPLAGQAQAVLEGLCRVFHDEDCSLAEINPLVVTRDGRVLALDAKLNLDDNARFRHPQWAEWRDPDEEDPLEREADRFRLNYVKLNGDIGCLVNGAGLAMATMDVIKAVGGEPANFLDVGGGANEEAVSQAFRILLSDSRVKVVLVNIFGGIMRCDVIARGVVAAATKMGLVVPLVVRLAGTHAEQGRRILADSGLSLTVATRMLEAAQKAVELGRR
jgi:succinyl-CoA synthetase beta subunit